jgi:hypothetical protein
MNAISMTLHATAAPPERHVQLREVNDLVRGRVSAPFHHACPTLVHKPFRAPRAKAPAKPTRAPALSEGFTARLVCALLVASATAGIVCVFLSVLERVQNWPVLNAWVGRLLGA